MQNFDRPLQIDIHSRGFGPVQSEMTSDLKAKRPSRKGSRDSRQGAPYTRISGVLSPDTGEELRLRVNMRERERMHDINGALDALRQVMPYHNGPSVKKLSKMSTLLLARNYIILLNRTLDELKQSLASVYGPQGIPHPACHPRFALPQLPGLPPHSPSLLMPVPIPIEFPKDYPTALMTPSPPRASQVAEVSTTSSGPSPPGKETKEKEEEKKTDSSPKHKVPCFCIKCLTS